MTPLPGLRDLVGHRAFWRKSRTPPSSARLWRRLAMLGAGLAVAMAWLDYSHLRRTKPPFVAIVRAEYGSSSRVSIDLPTVTEEFVLST